MTTFNIEKRLTQLEQQARPAHFDTHVKFRAGMKGIADTLRAQDIPDEDLSTMDLCVLAIDWENIFDYFRVLRFIVATRSEFNSKFTEHDDTDEFRARLMARVKARGISTAENTFIPDPAFNHHHILQGEDRAVANELCRFLCYWMDNDPRYCDMFQ